MVTVSACAGRYRTEPVHQVDQLQARLDIALRTRAQLSYYLVHEGAVARPPMPALVAEVAGSAPYEGARWNTGVWVWANGRWEWRAGTWSDPDVFTGTDSVAFGGESESESGIGWYAADVIANLLDGYGSRSPEHRRTEHRNTSSWKSSSAPDATVRDHRTLSSSSWKSSSSPDATVRDHRSESKDDSKKDDDKKQDFGGGRFVRDHH